MMADGERLLLRPPRMALPTPAAEECLLNPCGASRLPATCQFLPATAEIFIRPGSLRSYALVMDSQTLTLTGPSALAVIRASRLAGGPALMPTSLTKVPRSARRLPSDEALAALLPCLAPAIGHGDGLFLRVSDEADRVRKGTVACRLSRGSFSEGSLWEVSPPDQCRAAAAAIDEGALDLRLLVDAPPLALASRASFLCQRDREQGRAPGSFETYVRILADELELCGRYGRDPLDPTSATCIDDLRPVTSRGELEGFLSSEMTGKGAGPRMMRQGLPFVVDGLRSPLESATHLCMTQSPHWGGLSFPSYECNGRLDLPDGATTTTGLGHISPDFLWRDASVALETEGYATHGTRAGRVKDNRRLRFYNDCGVTVFPALFDEVCTRRGMDSVLAGLAHALCERSGERGALMERRFKRTFSDRTGMQRRNVILGTLLPTRRNDE